VAGRFGARRRAKHTGRGNWRPLPRMGGQDRVEDGGGNGRNLLASGGLHLGDADLAIRWGMATW